MKRPLVCIPGAFCGGWAFDALRPGWEAAGHEVTTLTLPGHGAGETAAGRSLTDYARAAGQACPEGAVLVGHSLGGLVAQLAAVRARPAGLALLAPSPAWGQPVTSPVELASAFALPLWRGAYWLEAIAPDWGVVREYTLDRLPPAEAHALHARMTPESGRALFEMLNWWLDPTTASLVPASLTVPALVLAGEHDRVHPPAATAQTAARLHAEHRVLPGLSHWMLGGPHAAAAGAAVSAFADAL